MACPMANDPPFATLNHFEGDSRTGESDFLRIGITMCGENTLSPELVHNYLRSSLALAQTDDVLCFHVDLSVPRITRLLFLDPTGEVEFLIRVLQLNLCKHYTI